MLKRLGIPVLTVLATAAVGLAPTACAPATSIAARPGRPSNQ